jgi:hypothetical protein
MTVTTSQLVADYQAAATADLATLQTVESAEGAPFNALMAALNTAQGALVDIGRQQAFQQTVIAPVQQALGNFQTLVSQTTAATTATAPLV